MRGRSVLALFSVVGFAAIECGGEPSAPVAHAPIARTVAPTTAPPNALAPDASSPSRAPSPDASTCVPKKMREGFQEAAWPFGGREYFCTHEPSESAVADAASPSRACGSVGPDGAFRREPQTMSGVAPPLKGTAPLARETPDGLTFELRGGARTPFGAVGSVFSPRHFVKFAVAIQYDEHVAYEGMIGNGVVMRSWVEEGPGCVRRMFDVTKKWTNPLSFYESGTALGGCYGDDVPPLHVDASTIAIVEPSGHQIAFVDRASLAIAMLDLEHGSDPDTGTTAMWTEGDGLLAIAYAAPYAGELARVDLVHRKLLSRVTPSVCVE